ncbi:MAG: transcriptional repressor [Desulfobulbus sp.]
MTHQRDLILDELRQSQEHPTADELYEKVKKRLPRISLATVYRNLEVLAEVGLIKKLEISGRQKRFDGDISDHEHVFCSQCHRIDNIPKSEIPPRLLDDIQIPGYRITGYRIEFSGICPACREKQHLQSVSGETDMACGKTCGTATLSEKQRQVLDALSRSPTACGSKELAAATGLETKQVSCQVTALKKKGLIHSPVRCRYALTDEGKKQLG